MTLAACEANQLYVAHDTVIGINAAVNTQRTAGTLLIGYDRDFATLVPRSVEQVDESGNPTGEKDVMSSFSCSELKTSGIFLSAYRERLITGRAAEEAAKVFGKAGAEETRKFFTCPAEIAVDQPAGQSDGS